MRVHFLSGLPRSGSTLLTTLLYQNPLIHTEGVSALCDLMWNAKRSLDSDAITSANRQSHAHQMVCDLPARYYSEITRPVVIDKCRAWTLPLNRQMICDYITDRPKIICCVRDIDEIIRSFVLLFARNDRTDFYGSEYEAELSMAQAGLISLLDSTETDTYLLVDYQRLIDDTQSELARIYQFLNLELFAHDLSNIVTMNSVDDSVYGLVGMHDVQRTIGKRDEV